MITELTAEQTEKLSHYRDKWVKIGLSCKPLDYERAVDAVKRCYTVAGLPPPDNFIVCDSPLSAGIAAQVIKSASVRDSVRDSVSASVRDSVWDSVRDSVWDSVRDSVWASVWDSVCASVWASVKDSVWASVKDSVCASVCASVWASVCASVCASVWDSVKDSVWASVKDSGHGSHAAHWLSFFEYFRDVCELKEETERLLPLLDLAHHCGWWIPYKDVCILQHRHSELHFDRNGQLHNENDMAIKYRDGFGVFMWHGRRIPEHNAWIITEPAKISVESIHQEQNTELRRIMLQRFGLDNYLTAVNAQTIDHDPTNLVELLQVDSPHGRFQVCKSICHTTGKTYISPLGDNLFDTVQQALNWRYDTFLYAPIEQS